MNKDEALADVIEQIIPIIATFTSTAVFEINR
jgi:hypothetical protein